MAAGFFIDGTAGNDVLVGSFGADDLIGRAGSDELYGGAGNDILIGIDPSRANAVSGEYDLLSGGSGADIFVLGYGSDIYYQGYGYATITDLNRWDGDKIYVGGSLSDYTLNPFDTGVEVRYRGDLIAYVANTTDVVF